MKLLLASCFLFFLSKNPCSAIEANVSHAIFFQGNEPYIEIYINISSKSTNFKILPDSMHYQAAVDVLFVFKQGEKIIKFDKYNLQSPILTQRKDFYDVKRYALQTGEYLLQTKIIDVNSDKEPFFQTDTIKIVLENDKIQQSDILLLSNIEKDSLNRSYAKNGYIMEPLAGNFYNKNASTLILYQEIYNSKMLDDAFALSYAIVNYDLHASKVPFAIGHKKLKSSATPVVFVGKLDISKLPSGNYKLIVEIRNRNKELIIAKEQAFQRSNPYLEVELKGVPIEAIEEEFVAKMTAEELKYALRAIACKMRGEESGDLNEIIKTANPQAMKLRLFKYWASKNANNPLQAYENYMVVARAVDQKYRSGFGYGFETDRGYVFMKYGRPDDVVEQVSNPDTAPYEIWVYYDFPITGQKNIKFLFYDAEGSGSMRLLNTTARGELNDPNWRTKLYKNVRNQWDGNGFDNTNIQDNFNRNADRLLEDF
ncbi:MAG: GWxTD domain-containing protein [Saprospiraceae bacterium]